MQGRDRWDAIDDEVIAIATWFHRDTIGGDEAIAIATCFRRDARAGSNWLRGNNATCLRRDAIGASDWWPFLRDNKGDLVSQGRDQWDAIDDEVIAIATWFCRDAIVG